LLLLLVALVVTAALDAVGALLVSSLLVVPAATVRLLTRRLPAWQIGSVLLVAAEGVVGLWLSVELKVRRAARLQSAAVEPSRSSRRRAASRASSCSATASRSDAPAKRRAPRSRVSIRTGGTTRATQRRRSGQSAPRSRCRPGPLLGRRALPQPAPDRLRSAHR